MQTLRSLYNYGKTDLSWLLIRRVHIDILECVSLPELSCKEAPSDWIKCLSLDNPLCKICAPPKCISDDEDNENVRFDCLAAEDRIQCCEYR